MDQCGAKQRICTNLPTPRDFSCAKYQSPSLSQTFYILAETKHYFLLRNSFLLKLYQGKQEPYLLWLTALNLHSLPRALLSSDYLHLVRVTDDVWRYLTRVVAEFKNHRQWCDPVEQKNYRIVMSYKSLLTCITCASTQQ